MSIYEAAPAGVTEAEIVAASIGEVAWKVSDDNPRGECLRLRLRPAGNYAFVFADVPMDWGRMLESVRAAAGASSDMTPEQFVGCTVRVVLKHFTGRDGSTRAAVARWLPPAKAEPEPAAAATATAVKPQPATAKVSRNAPPQFGADDDLPF